MKFLSEVDRRLIEVAAQAALEYGRVSPDMTPLDDAIDRFRFLIETSGPTALPTARLINFLSEALWRKGDRSPGTEHLEEATAVARRSLEKINRDEFPQDWAATQNNLGNALSTLGERESGTARLEEAVAAYRAALAEWTEAAAPHWHGIATRNLARAEALLAARLG